MCFIVSRLLCREGGWFSQTPLFLARFQGGSSCFGCIWARGDQQGSGESSVTGSLVSGTDFPSVQSASSRPSPPLLTY